MAIDTFKDEVGRLLDTEQAGRAEQLDRAAESVQGGLRALWQSGGQPARRLKDFLHGTWLGHSLHPVLTDLPIGAWTLGVLSDFLGWRSSADRAFTAGVLAAVPTALAGAADWGETEGKQRRVGLLHALLNSAALTGFIGSLVARRNGYRLVGVVLSTASYMVASTSAWLGGKLVYEQGTGVSRNAWDPDQMAGFKVAARATDLQEGQPARGEVEVDGQRLPLVLLKSGQEVLALNGTCNHWGGPLWEGKVVQAPDGTPCIECPWHASTFSMRDGSPLHGPAAMGQPAFEARLRAGNVEVRLVPPDSAPGWR